MSLLVQNSHPEEIYFVEFCSSFESRHGKQMEDVWLGKEMNLKLFMSVLMFGLQTFKQGKGECFSHWNRQLFNVIVTLTFVLQVF